VKKTLNMRKATVGVTPGIDSGAGGEGFLRIASANSRENLAEALGRLEKYLADLRAWR
jgi:aspartate/methionine/tyrosine aminotransferase